ARHGTAHGRVRLAGWLGLHVAAALLGAAARLLRDGPPARLEAGWGAVPNLLVVSGRAPVSIPMRVLDARGRVLPPAPVRYAWESGAPAEVSPEGVVRCGQRGDAMVRATLGDVTARVRVSCQPVWYVSMPRWYNFVAGDAPQPLRMGAMGLDGRPVTRLAADVAVADPSVARVVGTRVHALRPGRTFIRAHAGGSTAAAAVTVFEPVRSLAGLRDDQRYVFASLRLAPGERARWPLPVGTFSLVNHVGPLGDAPDLAVSGPVRCQPAPGPGVHQTFCRAWRRGATVTLSRPADAATPVDGALALERDRP
ncbi:hypothetical protein, partial [Roseisolibacter sp. H3M3-2]|uniref:hypothetical protein n=1 Tax=Roseisolibacter sp. H3M3-2 TaxID=3031323 RepID=UPI0023DC04B2